MIFGRREQNDCGGWALQELFIFIFILHINTCCVALMILAEDNRMIVVGLARSCVVVLLCCCCVVVCCVALMIFGRRQEKDCGGPCKKAETALGRDQKDRSATSKIARLVLLLTRAKIWKCIQNKIKENKSANIRSV